MFKNLFILVLLAILIMVLYNLYSLRSAIHVLSTTNHSNTGTSEYEKDKEITNKLLEGISIDI